MSNRRKRIAFSFVTFNLALGLFLAFSAPFWAALIISIQLAFAAFWITEDKKDEVENV